MGRWSRLNCCWILAAAGCATPGIDKNAVSKHGFSDSMPQVSVQPIASTQVTKDPDLAPEKAASLCMATAEELEKNGHLEQAINQYELALRHQPKTPGLGKKLATCYARAGKYDQAITQYQKELAASPKDVDLLNDLGYTYYEKEDFVNAEKYLRQAVAIKPGNQRAQGNLGLALGRQLRWKESLEAFRKAGNAATAQANLAAMYFAARQFDDARRSCSIALGLEPNLKSAKELMIKLDDMARDDQKSLKKSEAKLMKEGNSDSADVARRTVEETAPASDANAIQLEKPVRINRQSQPQEFRPAGR